MKWTIAMTQEELNRKTIIVQAIDKRITQREGANKLGISERHFRRLLQRYRERGDEGLVSGHRGKPSNNQMKADTRTQVVKFIEDPMYTGFGPTFLNKTLGAYTGIRISKESMRKIMIEEGKHHPKKIGKRDSIPHESAAAAGGN